MSFPQLPEGTPYTYCLLAQHTNNSAETIQVCIHPSCTSKGMPKVRTISLHLGVLVLRTWEMGEGNCLPTLGRFLKNIHLSFFTFSENRSSAVGFVLHTKIVTAHFKGFTCSVTAVYRLLKVSETWLFGMCILPIFYFVLK